MNFFTRNLVIGFGIGVVLGVIGAKYYKDNKEKIDGAFKRFKGQDAEQSSEMTLEELQTQKERLEDLIADMENKQ